MRLLLFLAATAAVAAAGDLASLAEDIDGKMAGWLDRAKARGAIVVFIGGSRVVHERGWGDMHPDTVFRAASISKSLAAWGVMRLVESGRVSLDAPVETYLRRWHFPPSDYDKSQVTLRRLLTHTAGLSFPGRLGVNRTLVEMVARSRLIRAPGSYFQYSNAGYNLAQLVLEDVTGEPFAAYMDRSILRPLGMNDSGFVLTPELQRRLATGWDATGAPVPNLVFAEQASGGLYTTARDLAKFVSAAMPGPSGEPAGHGLLKPESIAMMITPAADTRGNYGIGYELKTLSNGMRTVSHGGKLPGWSTQFTFIPEIRDALIVAINGDLGFTFLDQIRCPWTDCVAGVTPLRPCGMQTAMPYVTWAGAVFALAALVLFLRRNAFAIRSGRRRFAMRPASAFRAFALMLVAVLWILAWHTDLIPARLAGLRTFRPASMMPAPFPLVSVVVVGWCVAMAAAAFLQPVGYRSQALTASSSAPARKPKAALYS